MLVEDAVVCVRNTSFLDSSSCHGARYPMLPMSASPDSCTLRTRS